MPLVKGINKYLTGIEKFDNHHKDLIGIINELYDELLKGASHDLANSYLNKLDLYVKTHFQEEENFMLKINYPKYEEHKVIHRSFIKELTLLKLEAETKLIGKDLINYLVTWLTKHILEADKEYASFLKMKEKGRR